MDNLTHSLIGATIANAGLKQKWGKGTTLALIVASNIPDIDVFFGFFSNNPSFAYRRMWTHSIVGVPLLSLLFGFVFSRLYKNLTAKIGFGLFLLGASLHVLFDLMNSYGVVILHPFSLRRFEFAWLFIIDLAIWAMLLLPFVLLLVPTLRPQLKRMSQVAGTTLAIYVGVCGLLHWRSTYLLEDMAATMVGGEPVSFTYVFPEAFGPHRFRGVMRLSDGYQMYLIHPLAAPSHQFTDGSVVLTDEIAPEVQQIRKLPEAQKLLWFFKAPVWKHEPGSRIWDLCDLRFQSAVITRGAPFTYKFENVEGRIRFLD